MQLFSSSIFEPALKERRIKMAAWVGGSKQNTLHFFAINLASLNPHPRRVIKSQKETEVQILVVQKHSCCLDFELEKKVIELLKKRIFWAAIVAQR